MQKRVKFYSLPVFLVLFILSSCDLTPTLDVVPSISFKDIKRMVITDALGNLAMDSVAISINFKDGDGDLGLAKADTLGEFADSLNNAPNLFYNNYHISAFKKLNGEFKPVEFPDPGFTLSGRFPALNKDNNDNYKKGPIEGVLTYGITISPPLENKPLYIHPGDTIKFEIRINDRAKHFSQLIETSELVVLEE